MFTFRRWCRSIRVNLSRSKNRTLRLWSNARTQGANPAHRRIQCSALSVGVHNKAVSKQLSNASTKRIRPTAYQIPPGSTAAGPRASTATPVSSAKEGTRWINYNGALIARRLIQTAQYATLMAARIAMGIRTRRLAIGAMMGMGFIIINARSAPLKQLIM